MNIKTNKTIWLLTAGAFFAFFVFGFTDNLKGPTLPALLQDLKLNYAMGGTILLGAYIGFMVATVSTGLLADRIGQKAVMVLAGISLAIGVGGYSFFTAPILLTMCMFILGFGLGSLELGCNGLIVELHAHDKGRYLNLMSVMHGLGSMLAPLYAGILLTANTSWQTVYRWDLLPIGLLVVYFVALRFPRHDSQAAKEDHLDLRHIGKTAFTGEMLWYYAAITLYVCVELGISSWIVEFLQKEHGQSVAQSTQALSLYFGLMMVGRFVGSFFVGKLGYLKSILIASLGASACVALSLFGPAQFAWLLPASGFFLSIIFPTITAAASDAHKENMNTILGLLFTFAGLGGVIGPWLVGVISDLGGLRLGFALNLAYGLLTALAAVVLMRIRPKTA